jgi:hypothetical protein
MRRGPTDRTPALLAVPLLAAAAPARVLKGPLVFDDVRVVLRNPALADVAALAREAWACRARLVAGAGGRLAGRRATSRRP